MKSLKVKLFSTISVFVIALSMLIIGVWAVGESQTITMEGSVNFNVADKSLYVQDVRMQEDVNSAPYSLKEQGRFMPGFINGNFDMNLGDFTNSYGSFALYFDIINTMDETTNETFAYTVDPPTQPSNGTATITILDNNGDTIDRIPQGTAKPSQISDSTLVTATIKLTIASTSSSSVDLSGITITINQFIPQIYDYFTFKVNDDNQTVTLTDYDSSLLGSTDVVIPSTVSQNSSGEWIEGNTYTVTAIASASSYSNGVFYNSGITSIELPSTLQSIGNYAFYRCSGITGELNLGGCTNLTSIGSNAFYSCSGLKGELNLGGCTSLTSIGNFAFRDCSGLTSISLPSSLKAIGSVAFDGCSGLTGELNLGGCTSLISIGGSAFSGCSGLTGELNLGECTSLTSIGGSAFYYCSGLTSITLPEGITSIENSAFEGCSGLKGELNLGGFARLTSIGSSAFYDCDGLTGLTLPSSITSIGSQAFDSTNINVVNYNGTLSDWLKVSIETVGANSWIVTHRFIINGEELINLEVPEGVESINDGLFSYCSGLKSVTLPSTLKTIGKKAFRDCSGLTSVDLSGCTSLTSIGNSAFYYCSGLTSVDLSGCTSLTSIDYGAFERCSALKSVVFPEGSTGWEVSTSSSMTDPTSVDVKDPSVNADNLKGQYCDYYWKRNV